MFDDIRGFLKPLEKTVDDLRHQNSIGATDWNSYLRSAGRIEGMIDAYNMILDNYKKVMENK